MPDSDEIRRERRGGRTARELAGEVRLCPVCGAEVEFDYISLGLICDECEEIWSFSEVDRK